jgi:hypothetical protein
MRRRIELLCEASWMLDAPVAAPRPVAGKARRRDKDRDVKRAGYGGTFCGCVLELVTDPHRAPQ